MSDGVGPGIHGGRRAQRPRSIHLTDGKLAIVEETSARGKRRET